MSSDEDDGPTLRTVASSSCKRVHIGTAVLPKPLFVPDWDEDGVDDEECMHYRALDDDDEERLPVGGAADHSAGGGEEGTSAVRANKRMTRYAQCVSQEFNAVVVEHHLKWSPLCHALPGPLDDGTPTTRLGRYDFHAADEIVDWALSRRMAVKGHVLVWHVTTPPFVEQMTPDELRDELKRHIFTTMAHFRGRIRMWDVVNEALAPDGTLAQNVFWRKLGPDYIEQAFRWAHEADPQAILIYNDNKVEGISGNKSNAFYNLLRTLVVERRVPIHGAGMQAHFNASSGTIPTPRMVKEQIRRIGNLGLQVNISEMDVRVGQLLPASFRDVAQRQIYRDIVAAALTEPAFTGIWLWGFTDRHTWVTQFYSPDTPLIFDEHYARKESYYGLREALETLTVGGTVGGNVALNSDMEDDDDDSGGGKPWGHLWMPKNTDNEIQGGGGVGDCRPDWEQNTIVSQIIINDPFPI